MLRLPISFVIAALTLCSLVLSALVPPVFAQKKGVQQRETIYHGILHADLFETYDLTSDDGEAHRRMHNEMTMKYDLTKDFHIAGEHDLAELPGKGAVANGSFHVIIDSSESDREHHETYKGEMAGPIGEGGFGFETPGPGDEYITAVSDIMPRTCVSKGNVTDETDDCGDVSLPELNLSRKEDGRKTIQAVQDLKLGAFKMSRPAEMDEGEDYTSPYWPAGVITGTVASGFTVDMTGSKTMHVVPSSVGGSYTCVLKKTLKISIKVNPSGKTGWMRQLTNNDAFTDLTAIIEPRFTPPFSTDNR